MFAHPVRCSLTAMMLLIAGASAAAPAQEQVRMAEALPAGTQYSVSCRVEVNGTLTLPPDKGQTTGKTLAVSGTSVIDYYERVQAVNNGKEVKSTVRMYRKLDFQRKVGDQTQSSSLRPEVRRLVVLRHNQVEVPFSPDGPLTWNEMDLVRTDVFTPALTGLLPAQAVRLKDRWTAASHAVQELTDLDKIEEGSVTCQLDQIQISSGRRQARINMGGTVRGIGEDGPTRHVLDGYLLFDLESNHISVISVRGSQQLLDKGGKTIGKIEGTFLLTRRPDSCQELSDQALRPLKLEPNEENTQLLYDNAEIGVRFLHPRRWRVAGASGPQIGVDENGGSGLLLTIDTLKNTPTAAQYLQESKAYLEQQKAKILRVEPVRLVLSAPQSVEQFSIEVEINGQRVLMHYVVVRQAKSGATIAARVLPQQQPVILQDIDKIAKSLRLQ